MALKGDKKIIEALTAAYSTEITGHAFYNAVADSVGDEKGKNVFRHLAGEELEHIAVVSSIAESLKSGTGWMSYEDALKKGRPDASKGLPIFHRDNELIRRLKKNQTDLNAVNIGLESEEKAVEFYGRLLKEAKEPLEKTLLTKLLEMEKGHLKMLRWESESLIKTGFWCGEMEYSVEKETD